MLDILKVIKIKSPWISLTDGIFGLFEPSFATSIGVLFSVIYPMGRWLMPNDYLIYLNILTSATLFLLFILTIISYFYVVFDDEKMIDFFKTIKEKIEKSSHQEKNYYLDLQYKYNRILPEEIGYNKYVLLLKSQKELFFGIPKNNPLMKLAAGYIFILSIGYFSFNALGEKGFLFFLTILASLMLICIQYIYFNIIEKNSIIPSNPFGENQKLNMAIPIFLLFIFFSIAKVSYVKFYGEKRIGSFFELDEYETTYYVKIKKDFGKPENLIEPILAKGIVKVFDIVYDDNYIDDNGQSYSYSIRYAQINKIFLPYGEELVFEKPIGPNGYVDGNQNCRFEIDHSKSIVESVLLPIFKLASQIRGTYKSPKYSGYCKDLNGNSWYIELTDFKYDDN